ncbi:MAG: hypothetical protein ACJAXQ_001601 [Parvibaculaceae bacterium]|jgi:hypothetical protein
MQEYPKDVKVMMIKKPAAAAPVSSSTADSSVSTS